MDILFLPDWLLNGIAIISGIVAVVVQIAFAVGVLIDSDDLPNGRQTILVRPIIWFLATLFGGMFIAVAYWLIHHSRLNNSVTLSSSSENSAVDNVNVAQDQDDEFVPIATYKTCLNCLAENQVNAAKCKSCGSKLRST